MKLVYKIFFLLAFCSAFIIVVKGLAPRQEVIDVAELLQKNGEHNIFFVGSSRVMYSLNPEIVQKELNSNVINLGMSGSTFLSNAILAEQLLKKGNTTLFIELSPLLADYSIPLKALDESLELNLLSSTWSVTTYFSQLNRLQFFTNTLNNYLFSSASLNEELKSMLHFKNRVSGGPILGYVASDQQESNTLTQFLTAEDLHMNSNSSPQHQAIIKYLSLLAEENNSELFFFLPMTYRKMSEKKIIIPVFNELPANMKISYPEKMIKEMSKEEYLKNSNHFNSKGAEKYSTMMLPLIKEHLHQ